VTRIATIVLCGVLASSCGAAATDAASTPTVSSPATTVTETGSGDRRIIPLDGDIAEIVFALGLGDAVVATDLSATYPPEADALPQIGYQRALNAEPILEFDPTIVIGTDIAGPPEVLDELQRVGVPVVIVPTPPDATGPSTKIRAVADALGVADIGDRLATTIDAEIAAATPPHASTSPAAGLRVAMVYLRGTSTQLLFGDGTAIDWLIEATGAVNVADELGIVGTADITAESLLAAAPDVLLVTEDGLASVGGLDGLVAMPSLMATPAAARRAVLAYDAQFMLGNGPRTGQFLSTLVADLNRLSNASTRSNTTTTERPEESP
jgi:iron complex transport system substrate-binding protein